MGGIDAPTDYSVGVREQSLSDRECTYYIGFFCGRWRQKASAMSRSWRLGRFRCCCNCSLSLVRLLLLFGLGLAKLT